MTATPDEILRFWFDELEPTQHFKKDEHLDAEIARRFSIVHQQATAGELAHWRDSADGRLAEIIVLDQFSRNLFRNDAQAWAQDEQALMRADEMVELELDSAIDADRRAFVYMPFMHSERLEIQEESLRLFEKLGSESNLKFAILHLEVIREFGRFPYRNELLGRESSAAEIAYVEKHGSF